MACRNCTTNTCQCVVTGNANGSVTVTGAGDVLSPYVVDINICEEIQDFSTIAFVSGGTPVVVKSGAGCAVATITIPEEFDLCEALNDLPLGTFASEETLVVSINSDGDCEVVTIASGGGGGLTCVDGSVIICGTGNTLTNSLDSVIVGSTNCTIEDVNVSDILGQSTILSSNESDIDTGFTSTIFSSTFSSIGTGSAYPNAPISCSLESATSCAITGGSESSTIKGSTSVTLNNCDRTFVFGTLSRTFSSLTGCFIASGGKMPNGATQGVSFGGSNEYETDSTLLGFRGVDPVQAPYLDPATATTSDIVNALIDVGIFARAQGS